MNSWAQQAFKRGAIAIVALALAALSGPAAAEPNDKAATKPAELTIYKSRYYDIHTDMGRDTVREAAARLTTMAWEYHRRTAGVTKKPIRRMPFYLFSSREDYYDAGGMRGTRGMYHWDRLMAFASDGTDGELWRAVQHEAFHQFAYQAIGRNMPPWLDEGLAEYFEQGIWTGDGLVTGLIPPAQLKRVKKLIAEDKLLPLAEMIIMPRAKWNADLRVANYDQAWSMVHFLVQAKAGKHQDAFAQFVNDIADGRGWRTAFERRFGDVQTLQRRYCRWWASLGQNPTADEYDFTTVQILTSYLARASSQGQTFKDVGGFFQAAREGELKHDPKQWLPPSLLADALQRSDGAGRWSLTQAKPWPELVLTRADGAVFAGRFKAARGKATEVAVKISRPAATRPSRSPHSPSPRR